MIILLITIILVICIRTINYGIFEIKEYENKFGGIFVIILAIASSIFSITMIFLM